MSSFVYGDIVFKTKIPFAELCGFAERLHNTGAMYLKFGGNVSNQYVRSCPPDAVCLQFEITDSILQNTADEMLAPATYREVAPLGERIDRMEKFVRSVFSCASVLALYLNLNAAQADKARWQRCRVEDFSACYRRLFSEEPAGGDICAKILITP